MWANVKCTKGKQIHVTNVNAEREDVNFGKPKVKCNNRNTLNKCEHAKGKQKNRVRKWKTYTNVLKLWKVKQGKQNTTTCKTSKTYQNVNDVKNNKQLKKHVRNVTDDKHIKKRCKRYKW